MLLGDRCSGKTRNTDVEFLKKTIEQALTTNKSWKEEEDQHKTGHLGCWERLSDKFPKNEFVCFIFEFVELETMFVVY